MQIAIIGLGKTGTDMARRLRRCACEIIAFDKNSQITRRLAAEEGIIAVNDLKELVRKLLPPRVVWSMVPGGECTEDLFKELTKVLDADDIIIDGSNTHYVDSQRYGSELAGHGIEYIDVGMSGSVQGLNQGYCLMVGGNKKTVQMISPALRILAPAADRGWAHVGTHGAGHFTKMIQDTIENGMMQVIAEGFALLHNKEDFEFDLGQLAELWCNGSTISSQLLDGAAKLLKDGQDLQNIVPFVCDPSDDRWATFQSLDQKKMAPILSMALQQRFNSQDDESYVNKLLAMMHNKANNQSIG
jgi:6-phosphogluconate dehydrogenase